MIGAFIFALAAFTPEVPVGNPARYVVVSLLFVMVSMGAVMAMPASCR